MCNGPGRCPYLWCTLYALQSNLDFNNLRSRICTAYFIDGASEASTLPVCVTIIIKFELRYNKMKLPNLRADRILQQTVSIALKAILQEWHRLVLSLVLLSLINLSV